MLVLIAVCLPLLIIMAAFAVDVAWMQLTRTELRSATDAAARAGAKQLSLSQSTTTARTSSKDAAKRNLVAGKPLLLSDSESSSATARKRPSFHDLSLQLAVRNPTPSRSPGAAKELAFRSGESAVLRCTGR